MKIYFCNGEEHYNAHQFPIADLLGRKGHDVCIGDYVPTPDSLAVVASYKDLVRIRPNRTLLVYMEHGAGQSYQNLPSNLANYYSGGEREGVAAILAPGKIAAEAYWRSGYKGEVVQIGCPKLQDMMLLYNNYQRDPAKPFRVGLCFHWDCRVCPETEATWHQWLHIIDFLTPDPLLEFVGFVHPRNKIQLGMQYAMRDVPVVDSRTPVDCLLCDNSSVGFELNACGVPVIWLDGIQYRKNVQHGLRFSVECQPRIRYHESAKDTADELRNYIYMRRVTKIKPMRLLNDVYAVDPFTGNTIAAQFLEDLGASYL